MEYPTITAESLAQFHALSDQHKTLLEQAGTELAAAKLNQDNEITIARDGKAILVREKDLWAEVWHLGSGCDAGKILAEKYPGVFASAKAAEDCKAELKKFALTQWSIDPIAITLSDILRICEAVADYKLSQKV